MNLLRNLIKAIFLFLPAVLVVTILYYLTLNVEQAIDVVVQAGEYFLPAFFAFIGMIFWSYTVWYSSRIMSTVPIWKHKEALEHTGNPFVSQMPRFLAFNCYIALQSSIMALPSGIQVNKLLITLFILLHFAYYYLLTQSTKPVFRITATALGGLYIASLVALVVSRLVQTNGAIISNSNRHLFWLPLEAIMLFLLQVGTYWFYENRKGIIWRCFFKKRDYPTNARILKYLGFPETLANRESPFFFVLNILAAIMIALYITAFTCFKFSVDAGPLAITLLFLTGLTGIMNFVKAISRKFDFRIGLFLFIIAFVFSTFWEAYNVRIKHTLAPTSFNRRMTPKDFLIKWIDARMNEIDTTNDRKFTAFIALSDGGASRAGNWSGYVLSKLQDTTAGKFGDHLFLISGASGGTVGNAAFYSLLDAYCKNRMNANDKFTEHIRTYFETDFLTFTISHFFGPDFFRYFILNWSPVNRADALEIGFEQGSKDTLLNGYFSRNLDQVFDYSGMLPAFILTSTSMKDGMPALISNIKLDTAHTFHIDILKELKDSMTMNFSTAALLSSRFSFVSPAGRIANRYYVDGGYLDNAGAGAALDFMQEVETTIPKLKGYYKTYAEHLRFRVLRTHNGNIDDKKFKPISAMENDLFAPVITLIGMQSSSAVTNVKIFENFMENRFNSGKIMTFELQSSAIDTSYPMSWVNSDYQLHRLQKRLQAITKTPDFIKIVSDCTQ